MKSLKSRSPHQSRFLNLIKVQPESWGMFFLVFILLSGLQSLANPFTVNYESIEKRTSHGACLTDYERSLKEPGRLKIAVALGYSDTVDNGFDWVTDSYLLSNLANHFKKPCRYDNQGFCQFSVQKQEPHEPYHFTRELVTASGQNMVVDVYLMNSSYDISQHDNVTKYKNEQQLKSERAQEFYRWALQNADIVFYEGHSRDGGGPDFLPPRRASNGKVNYSWYHKNQPGLKFLLSALQSASSSPYFLGLFSCASRLHFQSHLSKQLNNSSLILSTRVIEALYTKEALLSSLESVLNFECNGDLAERIRNYSFVIHKVK